jgi:hypothetical protein
LEDSTLTSFALHRLLQHAETVIVEGKSYRMKDQIETPHRDCAGRKFAFGEPLVVGVS